MKSQKEIPKFIIDRIVRRALDEDISGGDLTSEACIDLFDYTEAKGVARQMLVNCGVSVAQAVFSAIDPSLRFTSIVPDGTIAQTGDILWKISGRTRSILLGERVALNLVQRMSGIATLAYLYVSKVPKDCHTRITDTRKTTPGLRALERYAVRIGGGFNHRNNLSSSVLIKDNHIAACGGVREAIKRAKAYAPHTTCIECEVDTLGQLDEALAEGVDIVLLDNMDLETTKEAVRRAKGKATIEASGGITLDRIEEIAKAGVEVISVGALTHSAPSADIGLDF